MNYTVNAKIRYNRQEGRNNKKSVPINLTVRFKKV